MGLERTALPTSWGRIGLECLNLTIPTKRCHGREQKKATGAPFHRAIVMRNEEHRERLFLRT